MLFLRTSHIFETNLHFHVYMYILKVAGHSTEKKIRLKCKILILICPVTHNYMRAILWRPNLFFQLCLFKEADQATVPDMKPCQAHYLSVCCVSNVHVQFCQFDKADATANFHRPPLRYHFFSSSEHTGVEIPVSWILKNLSDMQGWAANSTPSIYRTGKYSTSGKYWQIEFFALKYSRNLKQDKLS